VSTVPPTPGPPPPGGEAPRSGEAPGNSEARPGGDLPPIRREILVDTDPVTAFAVFTERIGQWWPLNDLSVYGSGGTAGFTDGRLVERSAAGEAAVWGTVTRWEPASALAFTWHPGGPPGQASDVEVTFTEVDSQTLVTLTHAGWERFEDPAAARAEYDEGWPVVLGRYREHTAHGLPDADGETWVALLHRPGPAAPEGRALFEDPRFEEHLAFLIRMRDAGYLVAAGSLSDVPGEGMTILRLPGAGQLDRATELATKEDSSVAGGFFTVTVRPWQVALQSPALGR
jgi:uncharacterized protein YciI